MELKNNAVPSLAVCLQQIRDQKDSAITLPPDEDRMRRAETCQELDCGRGFECLHGNQGGEQRWAVCRRVVPSMGRRCFPREFPFNRRTEGGQHPEDEHPTKRRPETAVELTLNLPDRCAEKECCENERCTVKLFKTRPVAFCVSQCCGNCNW